MNGGVVNQTIILDLICAFDTTKSSLHINGHDYIVTPEDFTNIMGIEDGGEDVNLKDESPKGEVTQLYELFQNKKATQLQVSNALVKENLMNADMNIVNKAYALLSLNYIVCPSSRGYLNGKYLNNIDDIKNKKWATHAISQLVYAITSFQKRINSPQTTQKQDQNLRIGGCVLFLQLFYMNKAGMTPSKDVQLLKYVKNQAEFDRMRRSPREPNRA